MKNAFFSILITLLKSFLTVKKIFLFIVLFATAYSVKTKFFNKKERQETTQAIVATTKSPLPIELKVELFCYFQKICKLPNDIIKKIFFIYESTITRKNLLFLSFYQDGFIGPGDGVICESNPPQFPHCKEINLSSDHTAIFSPANPFEKNSKDRIRIEETKTEQRITIGLKENAFIAQIFAEIVEIIPHFQYTTLEECQVINSIFYTIHMCKNIDQIERASKKLLTIQSEKLRFMLFEQLRIRAYHFWHSLEWNDTQKTAGALLKTDTILVHPHFFYWQINNNLSDDDDDRVRLMNSNKCYSLFKSERRWTTCTETLLGESACSFTIYSDYDHKYIKYPLPFIIINKQNKPLRMH